MKKYEVVTADTYKVVRKGFNTMRGAADWACDNDYGQYEEDGGLKIIPYDDSLDEFLSYFG